MSFFHVPAVLTTLYFWSPFSDFPRCLFWDIHMVDISERRNCRPDEPSGISNKIQMGEFSQTTCIADDQANHRSQPRDVGEAPSLPIRCPAPTGTHNVVTVSFWCGENHSASAASISDPHHFSLSVLPGTYVSAPPVAAADECISTTSTTTLDEVVSTNIFVLLSPIIHVFQPSRNHFPNLEAK